MARYFDKRSAYREDIALHVDADSFQDNQLRTLCENQLNYPGTTKLPQVTTTPVQNVFAALAIVPNVWVSFGMFIANWGSYLAVHSSLQLGCFLGNWRTWVVSSLFLLASYVLLKFSNQLGGLKDKLRQTHPHNPGRLVGFLACLTGYLSWLNKLLPQFSGLSQQIVFSLFLRSFVYAEIVSIASKMVDLVSGSMLCPPVLNVSSTTTTTTSFTTTSTTTTIGFDTYFGNEDFAPYYSYYIPATIFGLIVSGLGLALFLLDSTTKVFPGHQAPSRARDRFERSQNPVMRKAHALWEGYNTWFDGNAFVGVGLYELLVLFDLSCSNQVAALAASCAMAALFVLRMISYPPRWVSSCSSAVSRKLRSLRGQEGRVAKALPMTKQGIVGEDEESGCRQRLLSKAIPILSMFLNSVFTLPLYSYFVYAVYIYFAYITFGATSYDVYDLSNTYTRGFWASQGVMLGLLTIDTGLSLGRDFTAVNDFNKAANVYKRAEVLTNVRKRRLRNDRHVAGEDGVASRADQQESGRGVKGRSVRDISALVHNTKQPPAAAEAAHEREEFPQRKRRESSVTGGYVPTGLRAGRR
jgi:hypothetical protein